MNARSAVLTALLFLFILGAVIVVLHYLGILLFFIVILGIGVVVAIILAIIIVVLISFFALPYYWLTKKEVVQEYGNYRLEDYKGKK